MLRFEAFVYFLLILVIPMKRTLILTTLLCFSLFILAQDSTQKQKLQFKLGLNYNSNLHYYGRTDSLRSSGIFPQAELWFGEKLYLSATPVFVRNAAQPLDYAGTVASLGYLDVRKHWITSAYVLKPFYGEDVQLVQSALQAQAGLSFTYLNKILNLTAGADLKYADRVDYGATAGIDHLFRKEVKGGSVIVIDPSVNVYAGTQNFSTTYTKKRNGFLFFPGENETVTESAQRFSLLSLEASLPLIWAKDKWLVQATPAWVSPRNLVAVAGRPDLSEQGKNMFYITAGVKRSF